MDPSSLDSSAAVNCLSAKAVGTWRPRPGLPCRGLLRVPHRRTSSLRWRPYPDERLVPDLDVRRIQPYDIEFGMFPGGGVESQQLFGPGDHGTRSPSRIRAGE